MFRALLLFVLSAAALSPAQEASGEEPQAGAVVPEDAAQQEPVVRKTREDAAGGADPSVPGARGDARQSTLLLHSQLLPSVPAYLGGVASPPQQVMYRPTVAAMAAPYSVSYVQQPELGGRTLAAAGLLDVSLDTPHTSYHKGVLLQHPLLHQRTSPLLPYCRALLAQQADLAAYQLPPVYQHYTAYQPGL